MSKVAWQSLLLWQNYWQFFENLRRLLIYRLHQWKLLLFQSFISSE